MKTEYQKYQSIMRKLDNELEKKKAERNKGKAKKK